MAWYPSGNFIAARRCSTSLRDRPKVAAFDSGLNVYASRPSLALDDVRRRHDLDIGHLVQAHPFACRRIDQHLLDRSKAVAPLGRGPNLHIIGSTVCEDVANFLARHQDGGGTPHIARLEPVAQRFGGLLGDLDMGYIDVDVLLDFVGSLDRGQRLRAPVPPDRAGPPDRTPKMRTTIGSLSPDRTSSIRSSR